MAFNLCNQKLRNSCWLSPKVHGIIMLKHDTERMLHFMFGRLGIAEILMILFLLIRFAVIAAVVYLLAKALLKYIKEGSGSQTLKKTLGEVIKKHREDKGFTQEMLAERLGVSRQAVSKWEKGTTEPSTSNLFALAKVFDMPIEDFMREIEI